jgi:Mrp family chromosome partitioning ATPase
VTPQVSTPAQAVTPALCAIPSSAGFDLAARNALSILSEPSSDYAAGVRTVASWAMSVCQSLSAKRIAFASLPGLEVDAATGAVATARQLAANNLRVVIVDGDMARGLVTSIVQSQPRAGLAELIAGTATFSDVIVCDYSSAAHIIQAGQNTQQARQMLDAERMAMVLEALEHAYDIVLVNAGKADFPAEQTQFALTASNAAVVLAQTQFAGPATALCGSLVQGGMKAAQYVTVRDAEDLSTASRIAAAVNS